ncbi:MAG: hypothetical protein CMD92_04250 [Gammaproteobacteria bacterium]|nr:hypothetical protein [Gammaproteobacteria bacterium]
MAQSYLCVIEGVQEQNCSTFSSFINGIEDSPFADDVDLRRFIVFCAGISKSHSDCFISMT